MRRSLSVLLVLALLLCLSVPALAIREGDARAVIGADLTGEQIDAVYGLFSLTRGSVPELTVTNAEERAYLEGLISDEIIGTRSISCVYIRATGPNSGLSVTCSNIDWCTEDMYRSALMTAGILDAQVKVGAPFTVSGTAALAGIYKAYESLTGTQLAQQAKAAAADELVLTAQLADEIDDVDAVSIVNEMKLILDETRTMSDDELQLQIESIASDYGYTLDSSFVDRLTGLCRQLEGLSISDLQDKVEQFKDSLSGLAQYADKAVGFGAKLAALLQRAADAIRNLFN